MSYKLDQQVRVQMLALLHSGYLNMKKKKTHNLVNLINALGTPNICKLFCYLLRVTTIGRAISSLRKFIIQ